MKRITIFSFILIFTLAVAACAPKSSDTPIVPETGAQPTQSPLPSSPVDTEVLVAVPPQPVETSTPTEQPTAEPTQTVPGSSVPTQQPMSGVHGTVNASNVNLRMGPGFSYQVIRLMPEGLDVQVMGRSTNGVWLEVHLSDDSGGWVFAGYVELQTAIASLPVTEAEGGPVSEGPVSESSGRLDVLIYIVDNQATLQVSNFPANAKIVAELGRPGRGVDLMVASGKTDPNGAAELSFEMPATWSNGKTIVESELVLVVSTADGSFSRSISVQYLRG